MSRYIRLINMSLFLFCMQLCTLGLLGQAKAAADDYVPEELVCRVVPPYTIDSVNLTYGTSLKSYLSEIYTYLLATQPGQDAESLGTVIETNPNIIFCRPNYVLDAPEAVQSSQPFIDIVGSGDVRTQPAATTLSLDQAHSVTTGSTVKVGVIDVGVNLGHPTLSDAVVSGFDFVDNDPVAQDEPGGAGSGHGSFIAGVIHLVAPDAQIFSYRTLDTNGRGNGYTIAEAVLRAINDGCKVINLSLVMNANHRALDLAIEYAHSSNVMIIAAAGNDSTQTERFPASDSYTLAVAALDSSDILKADFSNYNNKVDICAPGTQIYAPYLDDSFAWWDGTSFAAPFVAGQAALLFALNPNAGWNDIRDAITLSATNVDPYNPGLEGLLGNGLINLVASLEGFDNFICGDANMDGLGPDIADLLFIVDYMFNYGPPPTNYKAINVDGNFDSIDIADLLHFVDYSFNNGPGLICMP